MANEVKIVDNVKEFAFQVVTGKNSGNVLFVLTGPQPVALFTRLTSMGLFVYAPAPETQIYFVSETPVLGLTPFQPLPIGFPGQEVKFDESPDKPDPKSDYRFGKKRRPRDEDEDDDDEPL